MRVQRGFTLVEVLVVLAILALLMAILLPTLSAARSSAKALACANQLRSFGQAMIQYAGENRGHFIPPDWDRPYDESSWTVPVLGENVGSPPITVCPADPLRGDPDAERPTANSYVMSSEMMMSRQVKLHGPFGAGRDARASASEWIMTGEKVPDAVGWALNDFYSMSHKPKRWWHQVDLLRHGQSLRSNHLYFDGHVSNRVLVPEGVDLSTIAHVYSP